MFVSCDIGWDRLELENCSLAQAACLGWNICKTAAQCRLGAHCLYLSDLVPSISTYTYILWRLCKEDFSAEGLLWGLLRHASRLDLQLQPLRQCTYLHVHTYTHCSCGWDTQKSCTTDYWCQPSSALVKTSQSPLHSTWSSHHTPLAESPSKTFQSPAQLIHLYSIYSVQIPFATPLWASERYMCYTLICSQFLTSERRD